MVVNCLFQLPELRLISLAIGTNFAPEVRRSKPSQHSLFLPIILSDLPLHLLSLDSISRTPSSFPDLRSKPSSSASDPT